MRKLVESTFVSLDGRISNPQEWSPPYWDDEHGAYASKLLFAADALLLGRATYEGFVQAWPSRSGDPFSDQINSMPKYVASRTLTEPLGWNASLITGDLDMAIPALKAEHRGNLIVSGCGELAHSLTRQGSVDEFWFWINPFIWAEGPRIFDGVGPVRLELVAATPYRSGVVWLRYRPAG